VGALRERLHANERGAEQDEREFGKGHGAQTIRKDSRRASPEARSICAGVRIEDVAGEKFSTGSSAARINSGPSYAEISNRRDALMHAARLMRFSATGAVLLLVTFLSMSSGDAQTEAKDSLGAQLVTAVVEADVAKARTLLAQWKTTGKPWPSGPEAKPLLFLAIEGREEAHPAMIDLLLEHGAQVATRGPLGMTALHWAAANGYTERTEQI
jgi:hypothetical protein